MKRFLSFCLFFSIILLAISCTSAYTSSDGDYLEKYYAPETLLTLVENPDSNIWIVDVRGEAAYNNRHIPTAKNYPSSTIMGQLDEIPKSIGLIFYCETGGRAQMVINNLEKEGYTKMLNWGGNSRWPYDFETNDE